MAMRLKAVIGSAADHWLQMQAAYDLAQIRNRDVGIADGLNLFSLRPTCPFPRFPIDDRSLLFL